MMTFVMTTMMARMDGYDNGVNVDDIDDDGDESTPRIPRRAAYETMFERGVRFWLDSRDAPFSAELGLPQYFNWGGPGNQGLDNMHSLYLQWLSLQWLQPGIARPAGICSYGAKNLLMQGVGLALSEQKGPRKYRAYHTFAARMRLIYMGIMESIPV